MMGKREWGYRGPSAVKEKRRILNLLQGQLEMLELNQRSRADPNLGDTSLVLSKKDEGASHHESVRRFLFAAKSSGRSGITRIW